MTVRYILIAAMPVLLIRPADAGDAWPEWRGATGQGVSTATNLPVRWSESENLAWKLDVIGRGWSTPVIDNSIVWVTTATDVAASEEEAKQRRASSTNSQPLTVSDSVSLKLIGIDLESGSRIVALEVLTEIDPQMIHRDNSYATPSPIVDEGRVYCHYGPCGIACVDIATREVVWTNRTLRVEHENGPGSSPILWNDRLIVHCDGIDQQYIIALDRNTGEELWKTDRTGTPHDGVQMNKSYATPLAVDVDGTTQIVSPAANWVYGYDPHSGRELWKLSYGTLGFSNASRPVAGNGLVYVCTGYMQSELMAIRPGNGTDREPEIAWRFTKQVPAISSPLLVDNQLYFVSDKGIATCLDAATGEMIWKERLGKKFWAAPLFAEGRLYFFDIDGSTSVVKAGRKFELLSVNALPGELLASAAAVDSSLLIRTSEGLFCLRNL